MAVRQKRKSFCLSSNGKQETRVFIGRMKNSIQIVVPSDSMKELENCSQNREISEKKKLEVCDQNKEIRERKQKKNEFSNQTQNTLTCTALSRENLDTNSQRGETGRES